MPNASEFLPDSFLQRTRHAQQERLTITPVHGKGEQAKALLTQASALLQGWKRAAEQLAAKSVWESVCDYLIILQTGFDWLLPRLEPPGRASEAMPA